RYGRSAGDCGMSSSASSTTRSLVSQPTSSSVLSTMTDRVLSPTPTSHSTTDILSTFSISLLVLLLQGIAVILMQSLPEGIIRPTLVLLMTAFTYEWIEVHLCSLTRRRRPLFDEVNLLQTYQPRARTMGHLFIPDPPTPSPLLDKPERTKEERDAFTAARDAHYENQAIEAKLKQAEVESFLKKAAETEKKGENSQNNSDRVDYSRMTIEEILEARKKKKNKKSGEKSTKSEKKSGVSPKQDTETCGVVKRENP
ncbi:hypothetical protein PFISCL1PPCAC_24380, partial [Pristionchus fissidentatus]